ncbi:hypothetical protein GN956_G19300 [Arapaima gigas]
MSSIRQLREARFSSTLAPPEQGFEDGHASNCIPDCGSIRTVVRREQGTRRLQHLESGAIPGGRRSCYGRQASGSTECGNRGGKGSEDSLSGGCEQ